VGGDRALAKLLVTVATTRVPKPQQAFKSAVTGIGKSPIQEVADRVEDREVEMRSAVFSLRMRLRAGADLADAFATASGAFTDVYTCLAPALRGEDKDGPLAGANERHAKFRHVLPVRVTRVIMCVLSPSL